MQNHSRLVIAGVMTGTSCDGLDIAAIEFDSEGWRPLWEASEPYPKKLREKVLKVQDPKYKGSLAETFSLHRDLGQWYASAVEKVLSGLSKEEMPDVIANHGQTVGHFPEDKAGGYTVQMGDPSWIVSKTGLTTISHFRNGDMSSGGEGAPLAPIFHYLIAEALEGIESGVAIHNLGGISNFTYLTAQGDILACDTGPANLFIDAAAAKATRGKKSFDRDGVIAAQGRVDEKVLASLMKHPFLKKSPPKSTGRDDFTIPWFMKQTSKLRGADLVATATAFTVESITHAYEKYLLPKHPLKSIYFTGGGTKNRTLMAWLEHHLQGVQVKTLEQAGFDPQYIEAQAFAFMGYRSLLGLPIGGPWTGVKSFGSPGWITPGKNWEQVLEKI